MMDFCRNMYTDPSFPRVFGNGRVSYIMIVFAIFYLVTSNIILYLIYVNDKKAREGDPEASKSAIFPVYKWILGANWFANTYIGLLLIFYEAPVQGMSIETAVAYGVMWGLQHAIIEGVAFLLMQKGLGYQALWRTSQVALLWGLVCVGEQLVNLAAPRGIYRNGVMLVWFLCLLGFYGSLWLAPRHRLFRRPAVYWYAKFWFVYRLSVMTLYLLEDWNETALGAHCVNTFIRFLLFALFQPYVTYKTLMADSEWWQGLDVGLPTDDDDDDSVRTSDDGSGGNNNNSAGWHVGHGPASGGGSSSVDDAYNNNDRDTLTSSVGGFSGGGGECHSDQQQQNKQRQQHSQGSMDKPVIGGISSPLQGLNVGFQSAHILASTVDTMQREKGVKLLNFSYIRLNKAQMLGEGSFSRVYRGTYKRRECAIKMIFTFDLTADEIRRVAAESSILSSLRHPNIIEILGVAVLPPSVCILLELCKYGSLSDLLRPPQNTKNNVTKRNRLNITYLDLLWLAIGCCRGLCALHACGPDVCHRDIKSMNFLVDGQLNAKVADLELGVSVEQTTAGANSSGGANGGNAPRAMDDVLANWAAPEIVGGTQLINKDPLQAADCYSFALVLWEMVSKQVPFEDQFDEKLLRRQIVAGERPLIECFSYPGTSTGSGTTGSRCTSSVSSTLTSTNTSTVTASSASGSSAGPSSNTAAPTAVSSRFNTGNIPQYWDERLLSLIRAGWQQDPYQRPTMVQMLSVLEDIYCSTVTDYIYSSNSTTSVVATAAAAVAITEQLPTVDFSPFYAHYSPSLTPPPVVSTPSGSIWAVYDSTYPHILLQCSDSYLREFQPVLSEQQQQQQRQYHQLPSTVIAGHSLVMLTLPGGAPTSGGGGGRGVSSSGYRNSSIKNENSILTEFLSKVAGTSAGTTETRGGSTAHPVHSMKSNHAVLTLFCYNNLNASTPPVTTADSATTMNPLTTTITPIVQSSASNNNSNNSNNSNNNSSMNNNIRNAIRPTPQLYSSHCFTLPVHVDVTANTVITATTTSTSTPISIPPPPMIMFFSRLVVPTAAVVQADGTISSGSGGAGSAGSAASAAYPLSSSSTLPASRAPSSAPGSVGSTASTGSSSFQFTRSSFGHGKTRGTEAGEYNSFPEEGAVDTTTAVVDDVFTEMDPAAAHSIHLRPSTVSPLTLAAATASITSSVKAASSSGVGDAAV